MNHLMRLALGILLGLASTNTIAETAYVTDMLQLGLHEDRQSEGRLLRSLVSGTELEVLDRTRGYARVQTRDGLVGWTKSAYLVEEKPPRLIVAELERQNGALREKLDLTQTQLASASDKMMKLERQVSTATVLAGEQTRAVGMLRRDNQRFIKHMGRYEHSVPIAWVLTGLAITLTLGFLGGLASLDRFIRRQHGGYRIY
jgi:SH3 domain protein